LKNGYGDYGVPENMNWWKFEEILMKYLGNHGGTGGCVGG
jgi:hypothetical protein